ncbi:MAG: 3-hydroxyacyl-CoA dehydrogenase/enoyl-CoA hydratase family protein [Acidobacteriales bacterium]|nr:3-hydroxyacyl-CoA dehydrogenase/enoyl-CoA hydratase family protein [Candidatus Koribacter versatilis]MBI3645936.1 3-hydroxyacyl-CoA dehydrogenase/enoyl-CoA hydratase family protein [Terriglobales bacterium]
MKRIHKVAILGAGTMGARIAAHFANAGVPSFLLDIVPPDADGPARNKIAAAGLEAAKKSKPAAFFEPSLAQLITVGNFEDDLKRLADVDWIIEAVIENLDIKRSLLKKVEAIRKPGTIVTTNTSGLPVAKIAEGFSEDFRRSWFGTHFFNPPRYMRLLELIPTAEADRALIEAVAHFCDTQLGKGVVLAKDTPNFIGNRIGTFSVLNVIRLMQEMDMSIEDVDALTGQAVGWPRSATFRTIDLVGLDILGHVVSNMTENVRDERSDLRLPLFFQQMIERKWLGDKTKAGFYKKVKGGEGEEDARLGLDWKTLEYRPRQKTKFAALEMAKNVEETGARVRMLLGLEGAGPQKGDEAGAFLWAALSDLWTYSANRIPEISESVVEIDHAMRLGFNWELGPFELWDAAGVEATVARMKKEGHPVAANVEKLLASGQKFWYAEDPAAASGRKYWDLAASKWQRVDVPVGVWSVEVAKKSNGVVKKNAGASLVDLGEGVGCIQFHSKMNAIGADIISLITQSLKPGGPGENFDAFVITNDAQNFSVGANLMMLLMSVQEEEWDEIDLVIRQFQSMTQAIKFSAKPVVLAPFGLTLGGGCEMSLHAAARQPHAELYMGLVEVGVGLLPGGGGCKEMLLRAVDSASSIRPDGRGESVEMMEAMKKTFETIATAKVATSAHEARGLGFLCDSDRITMNRERVLFDAKARALELVRAGCRPPVMRTDIPAPGENILAALKMGVYLMRQGDFISDHEQKLGNKIAEVLCGGNVTSGTPVSEQYLLDLEREAFKSLCGEKKTQERIQYTLKTGKTLRN